jgi:hypothetical protein
MFQALKPLMGIVGTVCLVEGAYQGLNLGGIVGSYPPPLSGIIGGLAPLVLGVVGTFLLIGAFEKQKEDMGHPLKERDEDAIRGG